MSLPLLSWIFAVGVAVHNTEEGWFLPAWSAPLITLLIAVLIPILFALGRALFERESDTQTS